MFDSLIEALQREVLVHITYRSPRSGATERLVEPLSLANWRGRLYLIARAPRSRERPRTFRLDRVGAAQISKPVEAFDYPTRDEYTPEDLFRYTFGSFPRDGVPDEPVRLPFSDEEASRHRDYHWPVPHRVINDEPLIVELDAWVDPSLLHFVLRLGPGVEVLSPASLREEVISSLRGALLLYGED